MNLPSASVVVPNFNHAKYLPRCLHALLEQTVPATEVIVIDDGSTDDSMEVLQAYARRHPSLRVVRNDQNRGVCHTLNRGLEMARGDYVCFPAADDEVLPTLFEKLLPLLAKHPEAGAAAGLTEWRCQTTELTWVHGRSMPDDPCFLTPSRLAELARQGRYALSGQHMLYRKSALVEAGGWIPELRWFTDAFAGLVVAFRHGVCHTPEILSIYNLFPTSFYNAARNSARREVLDRFLRLLESAPYSDVTPVLRSSGVLGVFGPEVLRVVLGSRIHWPFLSPPFLRQAVRRSAELFGRRVLPKPLARVALRLFRGGRRTAAQAARLP